MERKYVIGERAAAALRPIIANGADYDSRPRRIASQTKRDPRDAHFLEVRVFTDGAVDSETGEPVKELRVYLGAFADHPAPLRINGKAVKLKYDLSRMRDDGWLLLGSAEEIQSVWLIPVEIPAPSRPFYYAATNQDWEIKYQFDLTGTQVAPGGSPGATDINWHRWLRPLYICSVLGDGERIEQGIMHGAEITIEVGDADGTHSGAAIPGPGIPGGFCSIEQTNLQQLQLYHFNDTAMNLVVDEAAALAAGIDLVVRKAGYVGQQGESIDKARVMYVQLSQLIELLRTFTGEDIPTWLASHMPEVAVLFRNYVESNDGPFWLSGGNASTCYGSDIADQNHDLAIDIDGRELKGAWSTEANQNFSVGGSLDVAGSVTVPNGNGSFGGDLGAARDLTVGANAWIGGNLTVAGDVDANILTVWQIIVRHDASIDADLTVGGDANVTGDVTADEARVRAVRATDIDTSTLDAATLKVGGDTYAPTQITYLDANGNPQTITVLKKQ